MKKYLSKVFLKIGRLEKESVIGLSMKGVRAGRFGVVGWIGVATSDHVFLFDLCSLGSRGVERGLANILTDDKVIKQFLLLFVTTSF